MNVKLMLGDNIESLRKLEDRSIDSVVTDPPYGLSFMNKKWDYDVPSVDFWKEVYRVLKPGGHILSFGGTRTYHRMVVNMEDAGFEIRDQIMWLYGSGFPKSLNIGKAIDSNIKTGKSNPKAINQSEMSKTDGEVVDVIQPNNGILGDKKLVTKNIGASLETEQAQQWQGWGTALKPANEPICLARKPLSEKSVAENVLKWGTGGINIDGCRVGTTDDDLKGMFRSKGTDIKGQSIVGAKGQYTPPPPNPEGRFPANIILECICDEVIKGESGERKPRPKVNDHNENSIFGIGGIGVENYDYKDKGDIHTNPECPCRLMDEQSGESKSSSNKWQGENNAAIYGKYEKGIRQSTFSDKGGASRFFYQAKVSKKERNMGLEHFEEKQQFGQDGKQKCSKCNLWNSAGDGRELCKCIEPEWIRPLNKNTHPTVKPVSLMTYLCRLITPQGGTVLDPFMGSGSTGIAARLEGFRFIGMELDNDYFKIAETRIENFREYKKFLK